MPTHKSTRSTAANRSKTSAKVTRQRTIGMAALGLLCMISAFGLGIHSAGDVRTIAPLEANGIIQQGDVNLDGVVNMNDVILILATVQGEAPAPTAQQLQADPDGDGHFTVKDALSLLRRLSH